MLKVTTTERTTGSSVISATQMDAGREAMAAMLNVTSPKDSQVRVQSMGNGQPITLVMLADKLRKTATVTSLIENAPLLPLSVRVANNDISMTLNHPLKKTDGGVVNSVQLPDVVGLKRILPTSRDVSGRGLLGFTTATSAARTSAVVSSVPVVAPPQGWTDGQNTATARKGVPITNPNTGELSSPSDFYPLMRISNLTQSIRPVRYSENNQHFSRPPPSGAVSTVQPVHTQSHAPVLGNRYHTLAQVRMQHAAELVSYRPLSFPTSNNGMPLGQYTPPTGIVLDSTQQIPNNPQVFFPRSTGVPRQRASRPLNDGQQQQPRYQSYSVSNAYDAVQREIYSTTSFASTQPELQRPELSSPPAINNLNVAPPRQAFHQMPYLRGAAAAVPRQRSTTTASARIRNEPSRMTAAVNTPRNLLPASATFNTQNNQCITRVASPNQNVQSQMSHSFSDIRVGDCVRFPATSDPSIVPNVKKSLPLDVSKSNVLPLPVDRVNVVSDQRSMVQASQVGPVVGVRTTSDTNMMYIPQVICSELNTNDSSTLFKNPSPQVGDTSNNRKRPYTTQKFVNDNAQSVGMVSNSNQRGPSSSSVVEKEDKATRDGGAKMAKLSANITAIKESLATQKVIKANPPDAILPSSQLQGILPGAASHHNKTPLLGPKCRRSKPRGAEKTDSTDATSSTMPALSSNNLVDNKDVNTVFQPRTSMPLLCAVTDETNAINVTAAHGSKLQHIAKSGVKGAENIVFPRGLKPSSSVQPIELQKHSDVTKHCMPPQKGISLSADSSQQESYSGLPNQEPSVSAKYGKFDWSLRPYR